MRTHVDGSAVDQREYLSAQAKLMARFSVGMLNTGPEQHGLSGEQWKSLDEISHKGLGVDRKTISVYESSEYLSYLSSQWVLRYAHIFGHLSAADVPIEVIEPEVESFQHAVTENIGNIRHLWNERTGQCLALQSSWEQAVRLKPEVVDYKDPGSDVSEPYYKAVTLFPHVVSGDDDARMQHNLLLANGSVHPEVFMVPIREQFRKAVQKDIDRY